MAAMSLWIDTNFTFYIEGHIFVSDYLQSGPVVSKKKNFKVSHKDF